MNELTGALPAHLTERPEVADKTSMGKDDFMKLLMAQLQNQDPLNPMDHKEFGAQLAQFASLEKLTQIGAGIEKLEGGMGEEAKLQALGMIGRSVKAGGAEINLIENQPVDIVLNTDGGFKANKVSIFGGDGKLVREMGVDPREGGKKVTWDGKNADGGSLPAGRYMFRVAGVGKDGKSQEMEANLQGKVIGVEMIDKNPMLLVDTPTGQTKIEMNKVMNIGDGEKKADGKPAAPVAAGKTAKSGEAAEKETTDENWADQGWPRALSAGNAQGWVGYKP